MSEKELRKRFIIRRAKGDTPLVVVTLVLVVFGLIMMFSASYANAYYMFGDSFYYIKKQVLFAAAGLVCMFIVSRINYHILHKFAWPGIVISVGLLALTLFMTPLNNARRWIIVGGFTFQPSELAKFAVILLMAHIVSVAPARMGEFKYGFVQPVAVLAVIAVLLILQPHISCTILICLLFFVMMFIGGTKLKYFFIAAATVIPAGIGYILYSQKLDYVIERINMWIDPFQDRAGAGHQIIQSLLAIGSGGLMGLGLGNSRQKHLYVPEPQNDFIFSIICEELGYIGALFVIVLFVVFIYRGFVIALHAADKFGAMLAIGVTAQISIQAFFNIAVVSGTVPNTGISLPFFSQGGTSLAMLLAEVGVLLSVSRYSNVKKI